MRSLITIAGIFIFLSIMSRCGSDNGSSGADAATLTRMAKENLSATSAALDNGSLVNAVTLTAYADTLAKQKPEFKDIATTLAKDATTDGALYTNLEQRLKTAQSQSDEAAKIAELQALANAADPGAYNDALLDPVNTLADLSGGTLPRIKAPKGASDAPAGSALVGNPSYGQWQSSPSGGSFWMWYGAYRMLGDLVGGGSPIGYNRWQSQRPWSYYNDYGSSRHGSPNAVQKAQKTTGAAVDSSRRTSSYGGTSGARKNSAFAPSTRRSSSYESTRRPTTRAPSSSSTRRKSNFGGFVGGLRGSGSRSRGGFSFGGK